MRLVLDNLQAEQAKNELRGAEDVLSRVARECYKWLLCPSQDSATGKPAVESFALNTGGGALGPEIERVCIDNELVIATWSPIHLRTKLKELYWKVDKAAVKAADFWEDTLRYLYLPRLKDRGVLAQAINKGAGSRDFFGTAYGQSGSTYEGFKLGDSNVQFDDTLLLIEPEAAAKYEASLPKAGGQSGAVLVGNGAGGPVLGGASMTGAVVPGAAGTVPAPAAKSRTFYGSVDVAATTAKVRLVQLAEEIVSVLSSDPNATVKITVEISADFSAGAPDQIKRAVSENATHLGFKTKNWE